SDTSGLACITNHFPLLTWHLNRAQLHIHWPSHSHTREYSNFALHIGSSFFHITCMFAYVHTHARGTAVIKQRNTHTICLARSAQAHPEPTSLHTHTPSLLHIPTLLQFIR